jgi:hypothetical protein
MTQRRFTSADFVPEGETGDPDAFLDPNDPIHEMKRLAGLPRPSTHSDGSPGAEMSARGTELHQYEREHNIRPGTDEWFQLWFAKPKLTGENPKG